MRISTLAFSKKKHMLSIFLKIMAKETSLIPLITFVNTLNNAIGHTGNFFVDMYASISLFHPISSFVT